MVQENDVKSRTLPIEDMCGFFCAIRGMKGLAKRKTRIRPFRVLAAGMGVLTVMLMMKFPGKAVSLERQQQQLEAAASMYYEAQSENNQLKTELSEINTSDFIERTARREYGYCWYGETIYEVGNLDDFKVEPEFDVYGQN